MRVLQLLVLVFVIAACGNQSAQRYTYKPAKNMKTQNMVSIPEIVNENIPGAPKLSQPIQIQGEIDEIMAEKHGYAYPALYDWNKDGKKDLLIGEFETGKTGSYLQIHLNEGTNELPKYSGKFEYAKDLAGDTITAYYWCCIGIHPRFVDLTGDGIDDMVTGSYNPGIISMWEGTENGFKPVVEVDQEGDPKKYINGLEFIDSRAHEYWNYSSANFADFNGDGLYDLFVAGSGGLRVALNIGTKTKPKFGYRQLLLDPQGNALILMDQKIIDEHNAKHVGPISGDMKSYIEPVDWDGDGVMDLLATSTYSYKGQNPIEFFRGVKTPKGIRFEQRRPLFTAKNGSDRPFPGSATQVKVEDFNNDGTPDLLIGMSILTVRDYRMVDSLAWKSLDHLNLPRVGKDLGAGYADSTKHEQNCKQAERMAEYTGKKVNWFYARPMDEQVKDMYATRHKGYVYVMYGEKSESTAQLKQYAEAKDFVLPDVYKLKTNATSTKTSGPVTVSIESTEDPNPYGNPMVVRAKFKMKPGWYLYADTKHNRDNDYIVTKVEFTPCKGTKLAGPVITPEVFSPESVGKYEGEELVFEQVFSMGREFYNVKDKKVGVKITYQTCNQDMCLPPVTIEETVKF